MMDNLNLRPEPGHPLTKLASHSTLPSKKKASKTSVKPLTVQEKQASGHTELQLKPSLNAGMKKNTEEEPVHAQKIQHNKQITRSFRYQLLFYKLLAPSPQTLIQMQLLNLRNGKPLSFDALKMLMVYFTRLGVDIHKIDRLALENPKDIHPSPFRTKY